MVTHLSAESKCPGGNENLRILAKSRESLETAGQRQDKKFQGNTHTHTHTHTHTISKKRVSSEKHSEGHTVHSHSYQICQGHTDLLI